MSLPSKGKILGLDLGTRRTGVAITDVDQSVAFPRDEIEHKELEELYAALKEIIKKDKVVGLVIGLPLYMSGDDSEQTTWTREISEIISKETNLPVKLVDERLTTRQAQIRIAGSRYVDSECARIVLESILVDL